jgi:hypothetical protein
VQVFCALDSALSQLGTGRGDVVSLVVISEASKAGRPEPLPLTSGMACLMPASVSFVAVAVVGVVAPDDSGVMNAGAMLSQRIVTLFSLVWFASGPLTNGSVIGQAVYDLMTLLDCQDDASD